MSARIPTNGAHARCVRAAIDGLGSIDECRILGSQAAGFVAAAGGLVIDHLFVHGESDFGLRLWAGREDLVTFAAGMRASLRCLVDRPGRRVPVGRLHRPVPRVEVNVALAPPFDPLSPVILGALDGTVDPVHLARVALLLATEGAPAGSAEEGLVDRARGLLALRPEGVTPKAHLISLIGKLGLPQPATLVRLIGVTPARTDMRTAF